jgi:hypothetical protein
MKELIKPNVNENFLNEVSAFCEPDCETNCNTPTAPCNKACSGGATNKSTDEKDEIIF